AASLRRPLRSTGWRCSPNPSGVLPSASIPIRRSRSTSTPRKKESPPEMTETVLTNARIVLADEVVTGSVAIRNGVIADVSANATRAGEDLGGDYLIPGLVELHTDHLEGHYMPRPKVRWNPLA